MQIVHRVTQDQTKWRGLIRRGAGEYEAKGISEAEQRKTRDRASPTEPSSSELSCSICNRQIRAKIGIISHLKIYTINCVWTIKLLTMKPAYRTLNPTLV